MMRRALLATSCLLVAGASEAAFAESKPTPWSGVWEGRLGDNEIVACFVDSAGDTGGGAYYYRRHLEPIALNDGGQAGWTEGDGKSRWRLDLPEGDATQGMWSDVASGKSLLIVLARVAAGPDACQSDRFNAPMEASFTLKTGQDENFNGAGTFRRLDYLGAESIEIDGDQAGVASVNRQLRALLPSSEEAKRDAIDWRRQEMGGINSGTFGGVASTEPDFWSPDFIEVFFHYEASGKGRNGISMKFRLWDLVNGKEVDPWTWIAGAKMKDGSNKMPANLFKVFNVVSAERPQDCEAYEGKDAWFMTLGRDSVSFWEDAWGSGCEFEFDVPYAKLGPYLTPAGKAAIARLLARPGVTKEPGT
jgi:hypothetical protein